MRSLRRDKSICLLLAWIVGTGLLSTGFHSIVLGSGTTVDDGAAGHPCSPVLCAWALAELRPEVAATFHLLYVLRDCDPPAADRGQARPPSTRGPPGQS